MEILYYKSSQTNLKNKKYLLALNMTLTDILNAGIN